MKHQWSLLMNFTVGLLIKMNTLLIFKLYISINDVLINI